jgi:enoyl-[acyl-carrier-protein] reductase (NADH)
MDVSCWSLLDLTRRAEKLMIDGGTILRDELSRRSH